MVVVYLTIIIGCSLALILVLTILFRAAHEKRMAKVFETTGATYTPPTKLYAEVLLKYWRTLKHSRNRVAVMALSEAIQKLSAGEVVKKNEILYILSQLDDAGDAIEEIKGVWA